VTLPNFLIIGAQKAGTTSLYYYLKRHPEIFMSTVKEPQFFASDFVLANTAGPGDSGATTVASRDEYEALFAGSEEATARGEASTIYLYADEAPRRIKETIPDVKLIVLLRNPVERAYSNFLHLVRDGRETVTDFGAALAQEDDRRAKGWSANWRYCDKGFYGAQIERYLEVFDREQIAFFLYEDFDADPQPIVSEIYRFLGVDEEFSQDLSLRLNVAGVPKSKGVQRFVKRGERMKWLIDPLVPDWLRRRLLKAQTRNLSRPELAPEVRAQLLAAYRRDFERVQELTGLDVSRWTAEPSPVLAGG
jgi:hypothetical protein